MTPEEELEEAIKLCHQWPPPEEPAKVDLRHIDYGLSLTPTERLRRNSPLLAISDLMYLADLPTLNMVVEVLRANAETNPFWNDGEPIWEYFPGNL